LSEQHDKFLEGLEGSSAAVFAFAFYLHMKGRRIEIAPLRKAPTAAEHADYADDGDLFIIEADKRKRVEVKGINREFTCAADWPFRDEILVSKVTTVDRTLEDTSTVGWVTLSQDMRFAVCVQVETREHWYETQKFCRNTGNIERFYAVDKRYATFHRIRT
jgi:hypothetical protein